MLSRVLAATIRNIANGVFDGTTLKLDATHQFLEFLGTFLEVRDLRPDLFNPRSGWHAKDKCLPKLASSDLFND